MVCPPSSTPDNQDLLGSLLSSASATLILIDGKEAPAKQITPRKEEAKVEDASFGPSKDDFESPVVAAVEASPSTTTTVVDFLAPRCQPAVEVWGGAPDVLQGGQGGHRADHHHQVREVLQGGARDERYVRHNPLLGWRSDDVHLPDCWWVCWCSAQC